MEIKLLIVDDHRIVRKGLQVYLSTQKDMKIVGEASNGQEALDKTASLRPDVVLMDLNMPILDGIEATKQIKQAYPEVEIIVLTSFSDQDHTLPALRAGAKGYVLKDIEPEELVQAIRRVFQGQVELHPDITGQLVSLMANPEEDKNQTEILTKREKEVLKLITTGKSNKEIGDVLFITEQTVKTHVSHVLDKLGVNDRTQAAILALKHKLFNKSIILK